VTTRACCSAVDVVPLHSRRSRVFAVSNMGITNTDGVIMNYEFWGRRFLVRLQSGKAFFCLFAVIKSNTCWIKIRADC
jgi:hypothetical protein